MAYSKQSWSNDPSTASPLSAERLNHIEEGIYQNSSELASTANDIATNYAKKNEVTNVMTPKGNLAFSSLPTTGNSIGWYYYCPDGDGTHGAGNYVWNGTAWYFGGTGDEGYNILSGELIEYLHISENTFNRINLVDVSRAAQNKGLKYSIGSKYEYTTQSNYTASGFLQKCNSGETYIVNLAYTRIVFYNSNKIVVGSTYTEVANYSFMIPEECVYFAWFRSTTYYSELMIVKGESLPTNYVDFNTVNIRDLRLDTMYSELYKMYRKSLYVGGDSIAFGAGSSGVSYGEIIANKYSMTITKNAVSGTTLITQTGKTNSILEKLQATTGTFDYMLLEGGINDMFISAPIGTITNSFIGGIFDTTTVIGAMEKLCETWVTKFPTAKKLFILVHRKTAYYGAGVNGIKQVDYWNAIKSVLNKWSIKYVDLSEVSNLCAYGNTYWQAYFQETSGTHPTLLAYQTFYVPILEREMFML